MSQQLELVTTFNEEKLPQGWHISSIPKLIGKDGVFSDGDWVESKDQDPNGDVRLIQLADIGDREYRNRSERYLTYEKAIKLRCTFLNKGDVLVARMPDPLGRACIFPGDQKKSVTVVDVCILRPSDNDINKSWLMYFINAPAFRSAIASLQSGSTRKRISRKNLAKVALPVPPSPEQNRIVEEIEKQFSRLDEAVAALKRINANLKRYKASVLKAAVDGKLTEEWRKEHPDVEPARELLKRILVERRKKWEENELEKMRVKGKEPKDDKWKKKYKEPQGADTTNLSKLPRNWEWGSLGRICEKITDGTHHSPPNKPTGQYKYITAKNLKPWGLDLSNITYVDKLTHREIYKRCNVKKNDVLYIKDGATTGLAVLNTLNEEFSLLSSVGVFQLPEKVSPQYLVYCLNSPTVKDRMLSQIAGVAITRLTLTKLNISIVPFPPYEEQRLIVEKVEQLLSVSDEAENEIEINLKRAERLRQSILKKAFSGKLT